MSGVMKGAETAKAMKESMEEQVHALKEKGIVPCLAIVRVGARPDDLAYERGAKKRMEMVGGECRVHELPETIGQAELEQEFQAVNEDPSVHGILLFRPLPKHLDEEPLKAMINPLKDVDCMSPVNIAKVFSGDESGFAPCTAEAVMKLFEHYGVELSGKRVTVVGRSMVVGKPLAMLLLKANATVTVCHTRTKDLKEACRSAEILAAAAGKAKMITADMIADGAVVADVGINVDEDGALCGDVDFEAVSAKASLISPVPGGVGSVTSSVLASHVIRSAGYLNGMRDVR
ncbi:bifunctional 5,10-methylenetetrahydrofolate dehydrogenase/5,10-methenyltetrahydrofolate cyclohydrolase [Eubacteriaceae bacterium Marseille-Q4139]|nr:bifunctional 5,10-methylenetetrahydrofolate dehydrogenase/5,10-methenyltetrahydrofolate cyclohydrolase [Eubacteriaceae bacterium Marseille-Q4139]